MVNKEIPLSAALIERFPASVELIQEAGTGYNNINVGTCRYETITVASPRGYSAAAATATIAPVVVAASFRTDLAPPSDQHHQHHTLTLLLPPCRGCQGSWYHRV